MIDPFAPLIDSILRAEVMMKAAVVHERLAVEYGSIGEGRVDRQVLTVRDHVLSGRSFSFARKKDTDFATRVPRRRAQARRAHQRIRRIAPAPGLDQVCDAGMPCVG